MHILLITDAWSPQINGVARTLGQIRTECERRGHQVTVVSPDQFKTVPCPTYPQIPLALFPGRKLRRTFDSEQPDAIHIATEGPVGLAARNIAVSRGLRFTTSYTTKFPEYVSARIPVPVSWGYRVMRWFHRPSSALMVATQTIRRELEAHGIGNIVDWSRGVDTEMFRPDLEPAIDLPEPVFVYVGRVAVEKNIEAFLKLDLPGSKLVVGGGPQLESMRKKYPNATFVGPKHGEDLVRHYAAGDVFMFPSRTDTFGLVMLEAMACGLPVAAFPVPGPLDVIGDQPVGVLDDDLASAAMRALEIPPVICRNYALSFSWSVCANQFLSYLAPATERSEAIVAEAAAALAE